MCCRCAVDGPAALQGTHGRHRLALHPPTGGQPADATYDLGLRACGSLSPRRRERPSRPTQRKAQRSKGNPPLLFNRIGLRPCSCIVCRYRRGREHRKTRSVYLAHSALEDTRKGAHANTTVCAHCCTHASGHCACRTRKMEFQKTVKTFRLGLKPPGQDKKIRRAGDNTILSSEIITNQKFRDHKKLNHHYHSQ